MIYYKGYNMSREIMIEKELVELKKIRRALIAYMGSMVFISNEENHSSELIKGMLVLRARLGVIISAIEEEQSWKKGGVSRTTSLMGAFYASMDWVPVEVYDRGLEDGWNERVFNILMESRPHINKYAEEYKKSSIRIAIDYDLSAEEAEEELVRLMNGEYEFSAKMEKRIYAGNIKVESYINPNWIGKVLAPNITSDHHTECYFSINEEIKVTKSVLLNDEMVEAMRI